MKVIMAVFPHNTIFLRHSVVGPVLAQLLGHGDAVVAPDGGEVLHHLAADVGSTRLVSARIVLMEGPANFPPAPSTQNTLLQLS